MRQSPAELFLWGAGLVVSLVAMSWVVRFVLRGPIKDDAEFERRLRHWRRWKPFWHKLFVCAPMDILSSIERPMVYEPLPVQRHRRRRFRRRRPSTSRQA